MALIRFDPFRDFDRFFEDNWGLVPMIRRGGEVRFPAMDVYQTDKDVVVEMEVPAGIDPERVDVSVEGETLTVRGETKEEKEEKEKHYYRKEIRKGSFERSVMLPAAVKGDAAEALYEKGLLKITIPKVKEEKTKRVTVRVRK